MSQMFRLGCVCAGMLILGSAGLSDDGSPPRCQNAVAIQWVTPGHFAEAQQRAARENRILMIKGIAFGIDEAGATCATKGCW